MVYLIIALFAVAPVVGVILTNAIIVKRPETPKAAVVAHGIFAVAGLGLLIYCMVQNPDNYPKAALILFVIAALGGIILLVRDLQKKAGPVGLVVVHALVAVTAFALLLVFALG